MKPIRGDWLDQAATQAVFAVLSENPTYVVGGCVRNTLLGHPVKDVDFATAARPEMVTAKAEAAGMRVVPTGVEHGTVTVIVGDQPFEVTTFRRDVETDGRRAVVEFADSLEHDALRRDFTINAIYADAKGHLVDPAGGLPDIAERRIRFIENAENRIKEDYLRSLRFFRFQAWFADPSGGLDPDAIDAIARNIDGLETLSRERVGSEIVRLLEAPTPAFAVAAMRTTGVLHSVLPGSDDTGLAPLVHLEETLGVPADPMRRLAVLGGETESLRLSRLQARQVAALRDNLMLDPSELGYRLGAEIGRDVLLVAGALLGKKVDLYDLAKVRAATSLTFPLKAADLIPEFEGRALGERLKVLEQAWIESGFTLSRDALLSRG
ncbi:MAG: CCA tRNA nucleotidyltransferase [Pseudomonadota bacterium]